MQRQRTAQPEKQQTRAVRASSRGAGEEMKAVANDAARADLDGQLGPDELPDAAEVVMNREAKRHRG